MRRSGTGQALSLIHISKGDMVYPVSQHIGAPAKPVVAVGDTVLKGQMIAEAGGFVSSPIYLSLIHI